MAKVQHSKSLEIFVKVMNVSKGTYDVLRLLGETKPRPIKEWEKLANLANSKPGNIPWPEWKKMHMSEAEVRSEQRLKKYKAEDKKKSETEKETEKE